MCGAIKNDSVYNDATLTLEASSDCPRDVVAGSMLSGSVPYQ